MFEFLSHTNRQQIAVMVSGGRSSHFMAHRMKMDPYWQQKTIIYCFANTGKEHEATLEFVEQCDKRWKLGIVWLEADVNPEYGVGTGFKVVNFNTAARNGEPFEAVIKKYGISNRNFPHCTRELKANPINKYIRRRWGSDFATALGMRIDEMRRVSQKDDIVYPLVGWGVTVNQIRDFWNKQDFDLQLKDYQGNCDLCWKKSLRKKLTILKENPATADWWRKMETGYGLTQFEHRQNHPEPIHFNRNDQSIDELLLQSQQPFIPATDPFWQRDQSSLMDEESPCSCMRQEEFEIA